MIAGATTLAPGATTPSTGRASGHPVTVALSARWASASWSRVSKGSPHAKQTRSPIAHALVRAVFRLIQRVFIAEATLWLTIAVCALAGFPAIVTAFFAALVELLVALWLASRTFGPLCRKLWNGGRA